MEKVEIVRTVLTDDVIGNAFTDIVSIFKNRVKPYAFWQRELAEIDPTFVDNVRNTVSPACANYIREKLSLLSIEPQEKELSLLVEIELVRLCNLYLTLMCMVGYDTFESFTNGNENAMLIKLQNDNFIKSYNDKSYILTPKGFDNLYKYYLYALNR